MNDCSFDSLSSYWGVEYIQGWYILEEYTCTRTYISKKNTFSLLTFCLDLQNTRNLKYFFVSDLANDWMLCINRMSSHAFLI